MDHYVAIVYQGIFQEFDVAQEFVDEAEARVFARSKNQSSVVIAAGRLDDWFAGRLGRPLAIYCYGVEYGPQ